MNNNFKIYDASAGSGKTFNLASNYIVTSMLCGFKNILAVTFTNAAAKEMKDRIIEVLNALCQNTPEGEFSDYKNNIIDLYKERTGTVLTDDDIKRMSFGVLKDILHGYSFFCVSTIDSFFQLVLKNLTKELGVSGNYRLSLERKEYDEAAVKSLVTLSETNDEQNKKILAWLTSFFIKKAEDNKSWNIEKELLDFCGKALSSDVLSILMQDCNNEALSLDNLEKLSIELADSIKSFNKELSVKRKAFLDKCKALNLTVNEFKGKTKGSVYAIIEKKLPKDVTKDILDNKEYPQEVAFEVEDIVSYIHKNYDDIRLKKIYYDCIYPLGVINYLSRIRSGIMKEDNVFLLEDTAFLLSKLNDGDVPFVFEKISQRVDNIFIDEFQDTNRFSFENLFKIIKESIHNGGQSYVFGDIKQSIYRFNGGDFTILRDLTLANPDCVEPLSDNFRSLGNIVQFNNDFFAPIYQSQGIKFHPQNVKRQDNIGIIRIGFTDDKDEMFKRIKNEINYYHTEKGYALDDIAVLFRSNKRLIETANLLKTDKEHDYNPVSDIAFKFSSSLAVTKIIEALKYLSNTKRKISFEIINWQTDAEKQLKELANGYKKEKSLLEVVMKIASILAIDDDAVFLPAFYDTIKDFVRTRSVSLQEFLSYWDRSLQDKSVDMAGVKAGVHLTSIHKSKGLAYKVVIVPYCDNKFFNSEDIWVKSQDEDCILPLFTANASNLDGTRYSDVLEREKQAQYMDMINLLYVAFTRARDNMSVLCSMPPKTFLKAVAEGKNTEINSLNKLLYQYVTSTNSKDFCAKQDNTYIYRNCETTLGSNKKSKTTSNEEILIDRIILNENNITFAVSSDDNAEEYFSQSFKEKTQREKGSLYHAFAASLVSKDDKQTVIAKAVQLKEDPDTVEKIIDSMFEQTETLHWFDNTYDVLNERTILFNDGTDCFAQKRPDRVMVKDDEVIVVDYKFGKAEESYKKQVGEYMILLKSMQAFKDKNIKGFLWYIDAEDTHQSYIEQVEMPFY